MYLGSNMSAQVLFNVLNKLGRRDINVRLALNMFKPSSNFLLTIPRRCFFCGFFLCYL